MFGDDEPTLLPATSPSSLSDGIKATEEEEETEEARPPKHQTPTSKGGNRNTGRSRQGDVQTDK